MKSSVIIIYNPVAKRASRKKVEQALHYLKSKGYGVEVFSTERKGHAEYLAGEGVKKLPSLIIAAGGDGTFNEVVNGIAGSKVPLAIMPLGTTNVLAKEIGAPENVKGAIEFALSRNPRNISLGKIVLSSEKNGNNPLSPPFSEGGQGGFRYFVLMAGIGYDGETVFCINERLKRISGKGSYIFSGIKTLITFNPGELIFDINGKTYSGYSAIIGKAAKYGGNFKITPDAKLSDPAFYICLFQGKKRLDIIRYVMGILTGRHLRFKDVEYLQAKAVEVKGKSHIQMDGDYFGMTPAQIEVAPDMVNLVF
jgi:diacylglycerol kinase (ATP)